MKNYSDSIEKVEFLFLTVDGAAVYLDTHPSYIRRLVEFEKLTPYRCFGTLVISIEELKIEDKNRRERKQRIADNKSKIKPSKKTFRLVDLRERCRELGLKVSGSKSALEDRLKKFDSL